jgi:anti-sigma factor RsiW
MHESVRASLEDYLRGREKALGVEEHLRACESCRNEVEAMRAQSLLFRTLKAPVEPEPGAGFYARVMNRIETQTRPSVWNVFAESLFAKRLGYASAMFLLLLGSVLVSSSPDDTYAVTGPEAILAGRELPEPVTMDPGRDRDVVLVNLATWSDNSNYGTEESTYSQDYQ